MYKKEWMNKKKKNEEENNNYFQFSFLALELWSQFATTCSE